MTKIKNSTMNADLRRHIEARDKAIVDEHKAARAALRAAEAVRVRFTKADLEGATYVRFLWGWRAVVRVNERTVAVTERDAWNDFVSRYPLKDVLEFKVAK